jgi:glycosyltransferase involved in cell wall biosynthesis
MNENKPIVSVLVFVYNTPASYLYALCESLLAQSYPHFECLILDDGSKENALDSLKRYRQDPRFAFFRWERNRGVNCAWFQLLTKVQGRYWCAPGSDDVLTPNFLEKRVTLLEAHPYAVFAHGPPEVIDHAGKRRWEPPDFGQVPQLIEPERCLQQLLVQNCINTPSVVARTDLTRLVLTWFASDWKYAQDWFLWLLLVSLGQPVLWDPEPLHQYRQHDSSLSGDPGRESVRRAEGGLVTMCALSAAARFSGVAIAAWSRNRGALYHRWLRRAIRLALKKQLRREWLISGAQAYYGQPKAPLFWLEVARHAFGLVRATVRALREPKHIKMGHINGLGWQPPKA